MKASTRETQWVKMACVKCARMYDISERSRRRQLAGERSLLCGYCTRGLLRVKDEHRDWWRERYCDQEIIEMAEGIWGPRSSWSADWKQGFAFE